MVTIDKGMKEGIMTTKWIPPNGRLNFMDTAVPLCQLVTVWDGWRWKRWASNKRKIMVSLSFRNLGEGHPQTCMMDGLQVATGATYGKVLLAKTFYGKLAATFYHPKKGAVRYALKPDFIDAMGKFEFFAYRKRGIEPSEIPARGGQRVDPMGLRSAR